MGTFQISTPDGQSFEVDAPDEQSAISAIGQMNAAPEPGPAAGFDGSPFEAFQPQPQFEEGIQESVAPQIAPQQEQISDPFTLAGSLSTPDVPLGDLSRSFVGQGVAFGFGDEIEAKIRSFFPGAKPEDEILQEVRQKIADFQKSNPGLAITTELIGAIIPALLTGGLGSGGLVAQSLRGAGIGIAFGGTGGFGRGEGLEESLQMGARGAAIGGVTGLAAPGSIELLRRGGAAIARPIRSALNPQREAARRVQGAFARDAAQGDAIGDQQFRTAQNAGVPFINLDRGGGTTRELARSAANTSPEGRAILERTVSDRFEGQAQRFGEFIDRMTTQASVRIAGRNVKIGGTATRTTRDQLESAARKQNAPVYRKAFTDGDRPLNSPELQRLMSGDIVVKAMRRANSSGKDRAIADGFGGFNSTVRITDDGRILFKTGKGGVPQFPNLQYWDAVKREIDDVAGRAFRSGSNSEGSVASTIAKDLRNELDKLVPSYQSARSGAHQFFDAQDAFEAGQNFVRGSQGITQARGAIAKMKPAERELFRQGYADQLRTISQSARTRSNVIDRLWGNPQAQEKALVAFGPKRAGQMEIFMRNEVLMDVARGTFGNSTTARQLVELGLAGGGGAGFGILTGDISPTNIITSAVVIGLGRRGLKGIDKRVVLQVAKMLSSQNPAVVQRGTTMLQRRPKLMNAFRIGSRKIVGAAGSTGGPISGQLQ